MSKKKEVRVSVSKEALKRTYAALQEQVDNIPSRIPDSTVSEFAEDKRVLPVGTPYPGPWRNNRTPYLKEIMDELSAKSGTESIVFMKSAQIGATAMVENFIGYIIALVAGPILYVSANEKLLMKWISKRLNALLISCGLEKRIFQQNKLKGQRGTGNRVFSKEFPGGSLDMATANSAAGLRSDSIRYLILDELDGYPWNVNKEGDPVTLAEARTKAFRKKKILYISTPGVEGESHIWPMYEAGDQRKYFVPCPHCGEYITLQWTSGEAAYGLKWEEEDGRFVEGSAYYVCEQCGVVITPAEKYSMLQKGQWRPTATSYSARYKSYHINALYSLMTSWDDIIKEYLKAKDDPNKMRGFVNLTLGLPYREKGSRPKIENVIELRGSYMSKTVPDDVLFLTAGIDVQTGNKKDPENPARLEMEVCGHMAGFRTASIDYRRFEGDISDPFSGAYAKLSEFIQSGGMIYKTKSGIKRPVVVGCVDSGSGLDMDIVYNFTSRFPFLYPSKGFRALRNRKEEEGDVASLSNLRRYRKAKMPGDIELLEISTNYYKTHIYNNLKIQRQPFYPQPPGFCDFPADYDERYFKMLVAEDKHKDGSFHRHGRRNEALDCRVMNMALADFFLDEQVKKHQAYARAKGMHPDAVIKINHKYVLKMLEVIARKGKSLV